MATTINSGYANSPKLTADVASRAEVYGGRGLVFDAVSDYLSVSNISFTGEFTISCWFKADDLSSGRPIVGDTGNSHWFKIADTDTVALNVSGSNTEWDSGAVFSTGVWTFVSVVRDSDNKIIIYKDGIGYTSNQPTKSGTFTTNAIGQKGNSQYFDGTISDVKFYSSALSESDIRSQYLKPESVPSPSTLVAWYPMSEANPESPQSIVYDHSEKGLGDSPLSNTDFSSNSNWDLATNATINTTLNRLEFDTTGTTYTSQSGLNDGQLYKITFDAVVTSGSFRLLVGSSKITDTVSTTGSYTFYEIENGNNVFYFQGLGGFVGNISNFSIKPILMGQNATTNFFGDERMVNGDASASSPNPPTFTDRDGTAISHNSYQTTWARHTSTLDGASQSWKVTHSGTDTGMFPRFVVNADGNYTGKTLKVSVDVLLQSGQASDVTSLVLRLFSDVSGNVLTSVNGNTSTEDSWQTLTGTFTPSDTDSQFDIQMNCANGIFAYLNNITVKEVGMSTTGFTTAQNEPTIPQIPLVKYNEKMLFNGIDNQVEVTNPFNFGASTDFSFSFWLLATDVTQPDMFIVRKKSGTEGIRIFLTGSDKVFFNFYDGSTEKNVISANNSLTDNTLHHCCLSVDRDGNAQWYINGSANGSAVNVSSVGNINNTANLFMGSQGGQGYFNGFLDDLAVFNTALSTTEVQELFNDGVALDATTHSKKDNLLGYWRNDGVSTWEDRRGWSYLNFDGSNDKITTNVNSTLTDGTYIFWAKATETGANKGVFGHGGDQAGAFSFNWSSNRPLLYLGGSRYRFWNDTSAQDDGVWHCWAVVLDADDMTGCKLYVDGVEQTVNSTSNSGGYVSYTTGLIIGSDNVNYAECSIAQFAVYSDLKDSDFILNQYNQGIGADLSSDSNLTAYYKMNNATTVVDNSSNSNNGTVTGATLNTGNNGAVAGTSNSITIREGLNSNKDGLGFPLKNADSNVIRVRNGEHVNIGNTLTSSSLPATNLLENSFTMSAWIKPDDGRPAVASTIFGSVNSTWTGYMFLRLNVGGTITFVYGTNSAKEHSLTTSAIYDDKESTWKHIILTFQMLDGAGTDGATITIYDGATLAGGGAHIGQDTSPHADWNKDNYTNTTDMGIGTRIQHDGTTTQHFNGLIDEVMMYNKVLSTTEIIKNYKHGKGKHKND